ncbi:ComEA family DNA-binding protein [Pseudothermotoga sp.]|nr:helix-hairpin-helix domain-containing protein [Pseudothermotoga sp.]MCX7813420.1 helix-hairpin-helix domain-containing protein [Pseudothermotoga sp.]MDW8139592.1 helix-hairpin-helix domain-containing protein [Pseudothermotoga sp.]
MKLSTSEKRLLLLLFVGVLLLSGAVVELGTRKVQQSTVTSRKSVELPIDLNSATEQELMSLPGIGQSKAKAIIEYRQKNGPFRTLSDLERVPGIGKKTIEKLAPYVNLSSIEAESKNNGKFKVNVNTARLEELMELPGIGEVKALEIIKMRQQMRFSKPEDLLKVPGIGSKTLEKIVDYITF